MQHAVDIIIVVVVVMVSIWQRLGGAGVMKQLHLAVGPCTVHLVISCCCVVAAHVSLGKAEFEGKILSRKGGIELDGLRPQQQVGIASCHH